MTLSQAASEEVLDIARDNLARLDTLTWRKLKDHFGSYETDWIKFLTFALSEYAYYDKEEAGYWRGLCQRLSIENSQGTQNAFRALIKQGVDELGLVQKPGRHVSTLWLQSGIPQRCLKHFAALIQGLEYGWWELAQAHPADLAILLRDTCEQRFYQFGTLMNFLKSSCSEEEDVSPISGTLLQGLARVAHELEIRGQSPEILADTEQRAALLHGFALPNAFFLRSWDSLIEILRPRHQTTGARSVISFRQKPLLLRLDIEDSFEIQLVLPAQHLYRREWRVYQSKFCAIPEAPWEGDLALTGTGAALEIGEDICRTVSHPMEQWDWHLQSHTGQSLLTWTCPGLRPDQSYLMFDANSGERRTTGQLGQSSELILFFPDDTECHYGPGIEMIDNWLPCSWLDWRGHLIHRQATQASITLSRGDNCQRIPWEAVAQQSPELQGTRFPGRQQTFIGVPTVWLPPCHKDQIFNLLIEDLTRKVSLTPANQTIQFSASSNWQTIDLKPWIFEAGNYSVRLWNDGDRWQTRFSTQERFSLSEVTENLNLQAYDQKNTLALLPIQLESKDDFDLTRITLKNFWPLETVLFRLQSTEAKHEFFEDASTTGEIQIDMASRHGALPNAEGYRLSYRWAGKDRAILQFNYDCETEDLEGEDLIDPESPISIPVPKRYWMRSSAHKATIFMRFIQATLQQKEIDSYFKCFADHDCVCLQPIDSSFDYKECIQSLCEGLQQRLGIRIYWGLN